MSLVGSYVGLSKWLVAIFPIFLLAWLRFGMGALAMAAWLRRAPHEPPLDGRTWRLLVLESFLGNFLFSICMLYGIRFSSALVAGVVMAALPAVVALLSRVFLRERLEPRVMAGIACAVGGIGLVALDRHGGAAAIDSATEHGGWGVALLLGAVICEASYVVIGKKLTASVSPKRISAIVNLWGLAFVTPWGLWEASRFDFSAVPVSIWALLVFYAMAASVWTVWLWMTGLRHVPAARAGVFTVMLPIAAAAVGVGVLGERFSAAQLAAFALAVVGLLLATWAHHRASAAS